MDRMAAEMITGFAFIILITVVVTMRTMYMLMCNFFFSCSAHFSDFQGEAQCHTCQRMIAVEHNFITVSYTHLTLPTKRIV